MHRFYLPILKSNDSLVSITDTDEIHHIKDVLRLKVGAPVAIFNGAGDEALGRIQSTDKSRITIAVESIKRNLTPAANITLACAIPKKAKFEFIIEKVTELGVQEIIPLITQRTEIRLDAKGRDAKLKRYQAVAVNAAKQSQRSTVSQIQPPTRFVDFLATVSPSATLCIPCLLGERQYIADVLTQWQAKEKGSRIVFCIGPEGDFTPAEVQAAIDKNAIPLSLGETVLKVDTAAIACVATAKIFARG